jgi:outer membrane protein OmpA-like peptidoglycan-associated protein
LNSWTIEVKDEQGKVQYFVPYTQDRVSIPGKAILGTRPSADYQVTMVGQTKTGKTIRESTPVHMVLWKPAANAEAMRYSVLYEFDDANTLSMYQKYIADVVTPQIPAGGTVIIHGYTDVIGDDQYNATLSLARANDVRKIIASSLSKAGRKDVNFEVYGFGEDQSLALFNNRLPEEHFYNRTVVIDIIPK